MAFLNGGVTFCSTLATCVEFRYDGIDEGVKGKTFCYNYWNEYLNALMVLLKSKS